MVFLLAENLAAEEITLNLMILVTMATLVSMATLHHFLVQHIENTGTPSDRSSLVLKCVKLPYEIGENGDTHAENHQHEHNALNRLGRVDRG